MSKERKYGAIADTLARELKDTAKKEMDLIKILYRARTPMHACELLASLGARAQKRDDRYTSLALNIGQEAMKVLNDITRLRK